MQNWGEAVDSIIEDNELQRVMLSLQVGSFLEATHCTRLLQMNKKRSLSHTPFKALLYLLNAQPDK